jgi:methionyl aminopeptidase
VALGIFAGVLRSVLKPAFQGAPELKSARELTLMRESGKLVAAALRIARDLCKPGVRTIEIDNAVEAWFRKHNATPLFKGYAGAKTPFPASTCISINEQVVHGIPGQRQIKEGDLVKLDTACKLNGWCADAAITVLVGQSRPERQRLIDIAWQVLQVAVDEMPRRRWWSEVAAKMQYCAESAGFSVVEQYVGHGIGRVMHENPQVPNFVSRETRLKQDFRLEEGMVLAVEPMVNMGRADTRVLSDHWTVVTRDNLPSAHVEHTLALTRGGVQILTADDDNARSVLPPK